MVKPKYGRRRTIFLGSQGPFVQAKDHFSGPSPPWPKWSFACPVVLCLPTVVLCLPKKYKSGLAAKFMFQFKYKQFVLLKYFDVILFICTNDEYIVSFWRPISHIYHVLVKWSFACTVHNGPLPA
jgi:hypothetical protein